MTYQRNELRIVARDLNASNGAAAVGKAELELLPTRDSRDDHARKELRTVRI